MKKENDKIGENTYLDRATFNLLSVSRKNVLSFLDEIKRQSSGQEETDRLKRVRDKIYDELGFLHFSMRIVYMIHMQGGEVPPFREQYTLEGK